MSGWGNKGFVKQLAKPAWTHILKTKSAHKIKASRANWRWTRWLSISLHDYPRLQQFYAKWLKKLQKVFKVACLAATWRLLFHVSWLWIQVQNRNTLRRISKGSHPSERQSQKEDWQSHRQFRLWLRVYTFSRASFEIDRILWILQKEVWQVVHHNWRGIQRSL
jgi:hypothetical protein